MFYFHDLCSQVGVALYLFPLGEFCLLTASRLRLTQGGPFNNIARNPTVGAVWQNHVFVNSKHSNSILT